jgi:3-dehydroquinate synthase
MSRPIRVRLGPRSYTIHPVESYASLPRLLAGLGLTEPMWIITHAPLLRRFGAQLLPPLARAGIETYTLTVPESEAAKSLAVAERVLLQLARQAARRVPTLAAFGGGVVGDLTGFVAAIFRRGVPYIQLPTTLLAQVDSAIGGKTGVDVAFAKNLVGAFNQPRLVVNHLGLLATLPPRQLHSGLAEVIKYGVMADARLFDFVERRLADCLAGRPAALRVLVERSCAIKARVVSQDERETHDIRITLNFGHSVGHALEAITGYRRFTHGEAIAVGMACASAVSVALGTWSKAEHARLIRLFERAGLPTRTTGIAPASVLKALAYDKKFLAGKLRWVLPTRIGRVIVNPDVPASVVHRVLETHLR